MERTSPGPSFCPAGCGACTDGASSLPPGLDRIKPSWDGQARAQPAGSRAGASADLVQRSHPDLGVLVGGLEPPTCGSPSPSDVCAAEETKPRTFSAA